MNNQKIESIKSLYSGAKAYTMFLVEERQHNNDKVDYILDEEFYNCARLGFITNIMLAIKEEIVEKVGFHQYKSLIFESQLEDAVNKVAKKVSNGYEIDNYVFDTAPNLVATLRDKLAHGNYLIKNGGNKITFTLDDNGTTIDVSVDKLVNFTISLMTKYLQKQEPKNFHYQTIMLNKARTKGNPMNSKSEVKYVCKNAKKITMDFKRKDGKDLTEKDVIRLYQECRKYNTICTSEALEDLRKATSSTFDFTYERKPITNINYDVISDALVNDCKGFDLENQNTLIAYMIENLIGVKNLLQETMASVSNLELLETIYKAQSVDMNYVSKTIKDKQIMSGIMELTNAGITLFQTLFSYANDDVYKNDFEYQQATSNGLDYSKLDLSYLNVTLYSTDKSPVDTCLEQKQKADKAYSNIQKVIAKLVENQNKALASNNNQAISSINQAISKLRQEEQIKLQDKIKCDTEYNNACMYEKNNSAHLIKRSIINSIRNCIAHGNYHVKYGAELSDTTIIFEDIHNEKLTFEANINFADFINMIYQNEQIISEFLDNLTTQNTLTRQK